MLIITLPEVYRFLISSDLIDFHAGSKSFFGKSLFSVRNDPHIAQITEPGRDHMMMFQESTLFPWLDVMSNVLFGLKLKPACRPRDGARRRNSISKLVGLEKFAHANIHEQRRRHCHGGKSEHIGPVCFHYQRLHAGSVEKSVASTTNGMLLFTGPDKQYTVLV